ncbi:MAG: hypothetical protein CFE34_12170 [Rhodobacteraceae bacterium PARR1]|nr:MAG: hypothetical protein CFE34_12170 [Rhodobacteraceae bacterium PARR1]
MAKMRVGLTVVIKSPPTSSKELGWPPHDPKAIEDPALGVAARKQSASRFAPPEGEVDQRCPAHLVRRAEAVACLKSIRGEVPCHETS